MILVLTFPALPQPPLTFPLLSTCVIRAYFHIINSCTGVVIYSLSPKSCPHHPKLWYLLVMEYYRAQRNNELEEFYVNWEDLQELMQRERSRTRRTLYTETDT